MRQTGPFCVLCGVSGHSPTRLEAAAHLMHRVKEQATKQARQWTAFDAACVGVVLTTARPPAEPAPQ